MLRPAFLSIVVATSCFAQDLLPKPVVLQPEGKWSDFPALATDGSGVPHVAFVQWDGEKDALKVAKLTDGALSEVLTIGEPGIIHQPSIATDRKGVLHVFWSQVSNENLMELWTAEISQGKIEAEPYTIASVPNGGSVFPKSSTDPEGNVWVVWQGIHGQPSDIFCRVFDANAKGWSREIQVTNDAAGDWEPCVAFAGGKAWVVFDSARGNEFNIYATPIGDDLRAGEAKQLIATDRYEGRVSAIGSKDGKGLWVSCERGNPQWGLDMRAHGHAQGLNGRKDTVFAYFDIETGKVTELPAPDGLFAELPGPQPGKAAPRANNAKAKAKAEQQAKARAAKDKEVGRAGPNQVAALNLPHVMLDAAGRPWLTVRYFKNYAWRIALTRYDEATKQWTKPFAIPGSVYSQDHQTTHALGSDGSLWIAWPSDLRSSKLQLNTGI
ncbi:MAG: hypothetical protein JNG86_15050, partial [Verrucomicrobiaceae bacterium]|nr:hypothetical protein [Verrucomicrobiaceae bacterium]